MATLFDPAFIRRQFPSLSRIIDNRQAVFLDGPGGTQTPSRVNEAMVAYLTMSNSNVGGAFVTSQETARIELSAREAMADLLNASSPEEIVFGQNMTSLTFAMSRAIARTWESGDEIVVTRLDHDANIWPWVMAAAERDVRVRWLDFNPDDCTLLFDRLPELLGERTRLVAMTHASNAVGSMVDVAKAAKVAHSAGALLYVDAVHYAPHGPIDVQAIDCDFLVMSAYKFFGPHTGVLYGKYRQLESLEAYKVRPSPADPPGKWETGTQSFESLAGLSAAVSYLEEIGRKFGGSAGRDQAAPNRQKALHEAKKIIKVYEKGLSQRFLEKAAVLPGLKVYGITDIKRLDERVPTFAVSLEGFAPRTVAEKLAERGIFVWDGDYYAVAVMEKLGVHNRGGLVRIGFVHYNTAEEVDFVVNALAEIAKH